jgi:hypothetical protein
MVNNISWQGYWISIALLTAGYYLVIYLLYFRKDFSIEWNKNPKSGKKCPLSSLAPDNAAPYTVTPEQSALFNNPVELQELARNPIESAVYACMDEVAAYLEEVKGSKCVKEELVYGLHSILRKYHAIAGSEYKESVTNVLVTQCEYHCSVHLSADDVVHVWVGW